MKRTRLPPEVASGAWFESGPHCSRRYGYVNGENELFAFDIRGASGFNTPAVTGRHTQPKPTESP